MLVVSVVFVLVLSYGVHANCNASLYQDGEGQPSVRSLIPPDQFLSSWRTSEALSAICGMVRRPWESTSAKRGRLAKCTSACSIEVSEAQVRLASSLDAVEEGSKGI